MHASALQPPSTTTPCAEGNYRAELVPLRTAAGLEQEWRALEQEADISFFVSWGWIGPWLDMMLAKNIELHLYRCLHGHQCVALAVLSRTRITRGRFFQYTVLSLHDVPQAELNMATEYNDLLIRKGHETSVRERFVADLLTWTTPWDELHLNGIYKASHEQIAGKLPAALTTPGLEERSAWEADISAINGDLDKLLAPLSRNRRWQIRRSFKAFQEEGEVGISAPATCEETLDNFAAMGKLHTVRWNSVGEEGSFANTAWVKFHENIIRQEFARGTIQLLRASAGSNAIGYIYSFIWRGCVYMLQSGFSQEDDNVKRPGFVSHCLAMQFNSTLGVGTYDFMCGDSDYKRVLAKPGTQLVWTRFQRPSLTAWIERQARNLQQRLKPAEKPQGTMAAATDNDA